MHSVINKRDRFGSFGWTQPYHFSPNDWKISLQILEEVCRSTDVNANLPMELLQYLIGELNYGGKIIYQEDKEVLKLTVKHFVNQEICNLSG